MAFSLKPIREKVQHHLSTNLGPTSFFSKGLCRAKRACKPSNFFCVMFPCRMQKDSLAYLPHSTLRSHHLLTWAIIIGGWRDCSPARLIKQNHIWTTKQAISETTKPPTTCVWYFNFLYGSQVFVKANDFTTTSFCFFKKLSFFFFSDFNLFKDVFLAISKTSHACKALHIIHDRHDPQYSRHKGFGKKYPQKLAPSNDVRCSLYKILFKPFSFESDPKNHIKSVSCANGSANGCCVFRLT